MKRIAIMLALLAALSSVGLESALAASLWNDRTNWISDRRPSGVGDIVTVVVDEKTKTKDEPCPGWEPKGGEDGQP